LYGKSSSAIFFAQIEIDGFPGGATQEQIDELLFRKKVDTLKLVDERAKEAYEQYEKNVDGTIEIEKIFNLPERIVYARD